MSRSVLDSLSLSSVPRVQHVLEAFPPQWFYHCETPAFSSIRARCDWSVPFRWSVVDYEPYDVLNGALRRMRVDTAGYNHRALHRMCVDMLWYRFQVRRSQQEQCMHWKEADNNAFRAWHDWQHVKQAKGFSSEDETALADLLSGGFRSHPHTAFIHWVETVCQVVGQRLTGDFPAQSNCLTQAEERAIVLQYERIYHVVL